MLNPRNAQRGFTLMELMVVIVIVAILAAVAVPLYINYVNDARNTEAKGAVGAVITAEQTFHQQNGNYVALPDPGFIANPTPGSPSGLNCDLTEALANGKIVVASPTPSDGFVVTATGKGSAAGRTVVYTSSRATPPADPWAGTQ